MKDSPVREGGLPMPEGAGIQMHIARSFVEADTAVPQFKSGLAKLRRRDTGNEKVDRLSLHMQAVPGDTSICPNQHGIVLGRPKAGNHMNLLLTAELLLH